MTSCLDVITLAMLQPRILAMGETPTDDEGETGLEALQGLYESWFVGGMFGSMSDEIEGASTTAAPFQRIRHPTAAVITLPTTIDDDGDTFPPYDLSIIELYNTTTSSLTRYLYDASAGGWVNIGALAIGDTAPLAARGRDGLAACLALSLAEYYGESIGPGVMQRARNFKQALSFKLGADRPRSAVEWF